MKTKLISLLVAAAIVSTLSAFAAVPSNATRVADVKVPGAGASLDTEILAADQGQTDYGAGPVIVAQGDVIEIYSSAEEPVPIDWGQRLETTDSEGSGSTPAFCNYYRDPAGGVSYPPSNLVNPC